MDWRAAGVLPLALQEGKVCVLLGSEPTTQGLRWLAFGGKRESHEQHPTETALREWHEESGGKLGTPLLLSETMVDGRAKFVLHVGFIDYQVELPSFSDADAAAEPTLNKRQLRWFPLEDLLLSSDFAESGAFPIKSWFYSFIQRERYTIRRLAQKLHAAKTNHSSTLPGPVLL